MSRLFIVAAWAPRLCSFDGLLPRSYFFEVLCARSLTCPADTSDCPFCLKECTALTLGCLVPVLASCQDLPHSPSALPRLLGLSSSSFAGTSKRETFQRPWGGLGLSAPQRVREGN